MNPYMILNDINQKIANKDIFKNNREFLICTLIESINKMNFFALITTQNMKFCDQVVEQYRAILKFIYMNDNCNGPIPFDKGKISLQFNSMILEFVDGYTPVRNYLEQCILGNCKIEYLENENVYVERDYDSFDYSRMIDKYKAFDSNKIKYKVRGYILKYLEINKKINIFKDRFIRSLMEECIKACWLDSEIKFDYDFIDFKYSELIKFCAAILLISLYYNVECTYGCIEEKMMINGLMSLTSISQEKIKIFMNYQTYDFEYQKDKLTLIQSFILINNKYYFNPITIIIGLLPIKMYRLICDYDNNKYKRILSKIPKLKEEQMTKEIIDLLSKYNISTQPNYEYIVENQTKAEYDLLILDNDTNILYIIELKWFYVGDGENEHEKLDKKIESAIQERIKKNQYIYNNKEFFATEVFGKKNISEIKQLIISQNFIGKREHQMQVVDFETLKCSVNYNNTFDELMNYIYSKKYKDTIQIDNYLCDIKVEDYNFRLYRIGVKDNN